MARFNFDKGSGAFFELIFTDRDEGRGAIVRLRIPKGPGRSSFVFHEEIGLGRCPDFCSEFVARLDPNGGGQGLAVLRNDTAYFSFSRGPDGSLFFEARCTTGFGEISFRAEVPVAAAELFRGKLKAACRKLYENGARQARRNGQVGGGAG